MLTVRSFEPDEWPLYRELRLRALRDAPDEFGSTLAREEGFPESEWITRLARGVASPLDQPLVAEEAGAATGLTWARIDESDRDIVTLYQVWVDPEYRRRGVGRLLLDAASEWARGAGATTMALTVSLGEQPMRCAI